MADAPPDAAHDAAHEAPLWGVAAEFATAEGLVGALRALRGRGLGRLEAYSPLPVAGAAALLDLPEQPVHPSAIAGALAGAALMFGFCSYATIWGYRFNIAAKPAFSWPAYLVPSVSFGVLTGVVAVTALMLALSRLPRLNHPAFNIPDFSRATADRYFLAVEARDARFDPAAVEVAIAALAIRPEAVSRVPR